MNQVPQSIFLLHSFQDSDELIFFDHFHSSMMTSQLVVKNGGKFPHVHSQGESSNPFDLTCPEELVVLLLLGYQS